MKISGLTSFIRVYVHPLSESGIISDLGSPTIAIKVH